MPKKEKCKNGPTDQQTNYFLNIHTHTHVCVYEI